MTRRVPEPTKRSGEFAVIANLFAPLARTRGALGLTDDAAYLRPRKDEDLIITTDAMIEAVHFLPGDPANLIAKKILRVNLSDLAAKGAKPFGYLLTLAIPFWVNDDWLKTFARGLGEDQARYAITLLGGDTMATPGPLTVSITAIGRVPQGMMIRRSGAKRGDVVFVTGTIGDGGGGLAVAEGKGKELGTPDRDALLLRYLLPEPRAALGPRLRGIARAALDVSDGLLADLGHIAKTSGVRIEIDAAKVPVSESLTAFWGTGLDTIVRAASAGDDYELAFTVPAAKRAAALAAARAVDVPLTEIGRVVEGSGVALVGPKGPIAVARGGYTHF